MCKDEDTFLFLNDTHHKETQHLEFPSSQKCFTFFDSGGHVSCVRFVLFLRPSVASNKIRLLESQSHTLSMSASVQENIYLL